MTRLHSRYPALADKILRASTEGLQRVVGTAVRLAIQKWDAESALAKAILAAVDGREQLQASARERLRESQQRWDKRYLEMQEELESNKQLPAEGLRAFHRARALAAVLYAIDPLDATRATEVVYEALASSTDERAAERKISKSV